MLRNNVCSTNTHTGKDKGKGTVVGSFCGGDDKSQKQDSDSAAESDNDDNADDR